MAEYENGDAAYEMLGNPLDDVVGWIESMMQRHHFAFEYRLYEMFQGRPAEGVSLWGVDDVAGKDAAEIAEEVFEAAAEHANNTGDTVKYVLMLARPDDPQAFAKRVFSLNPEDFQKGDWQTENGETPVGMMAQAHRHAEVYMRTLVGSMSDIYRHQQNQLRQMGDMANRSFQMSLQMIDMREKFANQETLRRTFEAREASRMRQAEYVFNYALQFLPDIAGRFGLVPGGLKDVMGLTMMLGSLSDEQATAFIAMVPNEHRAFVQNARNNARSRYLATQQNLSKQLPASGQVPANGTAAAGGSPGNGGGNSGTEVPKDQEVHLDSGLVSRATRALCLLMTTIPDEVYPKVEEQFPPEGRAILADIRTKSKAALAIVDAGGQADAPDVSAAEPHIVQMIATAPDTQYKGFVAMLPEEIQRIVGGLRAQLFKS